MAYLAEFINDAEQIIEEVLQRHSEKENDLLSDYKSARTIQRIFRGYITRKHLKFLNDKAVIIQKNWRGYYGRNLYFNLLQETVKKFYEEGYNRRATTIQKNWRGYLIREYVFSYNKLKRWKQHILAHNKFLLKVLKKYRKGVLQFNEAKMAEESEKWITFMLFKNHHLLRTYQRKGVLSLKGPDKKEYSFIEELLRQAMSYTQYLKEKNKADRKKKGDIPITTNDNYLFKGRFRECEDAWKQRYRDNPHSVFASGVYGEEKDEHILKEFLIEDALIIQDKLMKFGLVRYNETGLILDWKSYKCPFLHSKKYCDGITGMENIISNVQYTDSDQEVDNILNSSGPEDNVNSDKLIKVHSEMTKEDGEIKLISQKNDVVSRMTSPHEYKGMKHSNLPSLHFAAMTSGSKNYKCPFKSAYLDENSPILFSIIKGGQTGLQDQVHCINKALETSTKDGVKNKTQSELKINTNFAKVSQVESIFVKMHNSIDRRQFEKLQDNFISSEIEGILPRVTLSEVSSTSSQKRGSAMPVSQHLEQKHND